MKIALRTLVPILLATSLLAACGGGDEGVFVEEKDPSPSGRPAAMAVAGATGPEAAYSTTDI